jgi:hypothetical protein
MWFIVLPSCFPVSTDWIFSPFNLLSVTVIIPSTKIQRFYASSANQNWCDAEDQSFASIRSTFRVIEMLSERVRERARARAKVILRWSKSKNAVDEDEIQHQQWAEVCSWMSFKVMHPDDNAAEKFNWGGEKRSSWRLGGEECQDDEVTCWKRWMRTSWLHTQ